MPKKNKNVLQKFVFTKLFLLAAACLSCCIIGLHYLKIIQPIEFASYDLLFYLKPPEFVDERITIVEWDEKSISSLQESLISDSNLNKLIAEISSHNPRVIGLDLYRDIPVPSSRLDAKENAKAHDRLNQTFKTNSKIIGIHKSVIPKMSPSPILAEKGRSAAADISPDTDVRLRKVYMFPTSDENGMPTEVPYIGIALGYNYLAQEGWLADNDPRGIKIHKGSKSSILKPLSPLAADNLTGKDSNWKLFVNWRKTLTDKNFNSVSAVNIIEGSSKSDYLFRDRLVIIGNSNNYNSDIHRTAIDRWQQNLSSSSNWQQEQRTSGVEIVAQVSSSIISHVLNNRNLIYPVPEWILHASIIFPLFSLAVICENHFNTNILISQLWWKIFGYSILFISGLAIISFLCFEFMGVWFSVVPSIIGIILGGFTYALLSNSEKEKSDLKYLKLLMKDFKHNIRNISRSISSANRAIERNNCEIDQQLKDNLSLLEDREIEFLEDLIRRNISNINIRSNVISEAIERVNSYQERTTTYLKYTYSKSIYHTKVCNLNAEINKTVSNFVYFQDTQFNYRLEPTYDNKIVSQKIYINDWLIIVENLLSNAIYAINPELNESPDFEPKIEITTVNKSRQIVLVVEDNGIGIPKRLHHKVFLPFESFKDGRGDGMGLYLVSQIVNCRKGKLFLDSDVMKGTKITISLPKIS